MTPSVQVTWLLSSGIWGLATAYYEFKINNITRQNTTSSTFDPADYSLVLNGGDVIEVVVSSLSSCTDVASITITENIITTVGTITSQQLPFVQEIFQQLLQRQQPMPGTITYQWQQSLDNIKLQQY